MTDQSDGFDPEEFEREMNELIEEMQRGEATETEIIEDVLTSLDEDANPEAEAAATNVTERRKRDRQTDDLRHYLQKAVRLAQETDQPRVKQPIEQAHSLVAGGGWQ